MNKHWRDRLLDYDERRLDPTERAALEELLDANPEAREFLAALRRDREVFRAAFAGIEATPELVDRVMRRLPQRRRGWFPMPRLLEVCAAGLMVFVLGTLVSPARQIERQRQALCQREVKDLSRVVMSYAADYDGSFPTADWVAQVSAHRGAPLVAHCPSDERADAVSYGLPLGLGQSNLERLDRASQVLMFDANGPFLAPRHERGANVGFLDGSVRLLREDQVEWLGSGR